ncbi:MAG TPA: 4-alpha-glucanotransferase [Acidimicrobiales bacterium]|nr:4-alpha-glucanotransferase [Acidimicrobiales bacterium]
MSELSAWGIEAGYRDQEGRWHETPRASREAVAAAMGVEPGHRPGPGPVRTVQAGASMAVPGPFEVALEDGATRSGRDRLPGDLPLGYHDLLRPGDEAPVRLIVSPPRCPDPPALRAWGWAVQLYALRSAASWGMGDLGDLATLAGWSADLGAGMVLCNPLHATRPGPRQEPSPYYPSSRCWRNPLYLRVADVPGMDANPDLPALDAAGRALNDETRIDRDAIWALKRRALEWAWRHGGDQPEFTAWRRAAGPFLRGHARFAALSELFEGPWWTWPRDVRHPRGAGVSAALRGEEDRVGFHEWLQWLLDRQLHRTSARLPLVGDLAVGVDPAGADAWWWQDCFALGTRVGAPPDAFNPAGQDWGVPPLDPWRLRAARYEPMVETLRAGLAPGGGLRIDHVMGLFRLWWVPEGAEPAQGVYVRYPWRELLDILALESTRAGAYVVGEDLGTVEAGVRPALQARGVLSYRLAWFEPDPPGPGWPTQALAAVTTHDLPTVAGLWTGADLAEQQELGLPVDPDALAAVRHRVARWAGLSEAATPEEVVVALHRLLARAPARLLAATLDDAATARRRPNIPGTTPDRRPNWSLPLPAALEDLMADPVVARVAQALAR